MPQGLCVRVQRCGADGKEERPGWLGRLKKPKNKAHVVPRDLLIRAGRACVTVTRSTWCCIRRRCSAVGLGERLPLPVGPRALVCRACVRAAYFGIMASPNLRIMGFGNPLLDISAVVEQETLDKCVSRSTRPLS